MSSSSSGKHASGATSGQSTVPEPSFAERARTLMHSGHIGSLSTLSHKQPGFPFGSLMPYALDDQGRPIFLISTMAMHTQNLRHRPAGKPVRVLICAPSSFARAGLERQLAPQSSLQVVGGITTTNGLQQAIAESDPDVVFLQVAAQLQEIRWEGLIELGVPIVLLTESVDLVSGAAALAAGVQGILVGDVTGAELATAAASAASGFYLLTANSIGTGCTCGQILMSIALSRGPQTSLRHPEA